MLFSLQLKLNVRKNMRGTDKSVATSFVVKWSGKRQQPDHTFWCMMPESTILLDKIDSSPIQNEEFYVSCVNFLIINVHTKAQWLLAKCKNVRRSNTTNQRGMHQVEWWNLARIIHELFERQQEVGCTPLICFSLFTSDHAGWNSIVCLFEQTR